jgi:Sec-independent protein translocase protein TatA
MAMDLPALKLAEIVIVVVALVAFYVWQMRSLKRDRAELARRLAQEQQQEQQEQQEQEREQEQTQTPLQVQLQASAAPDSERPAGLSGPSDPSSSRHP